MIYPAALRPNAQENFALSWGKSIQIPIINYSFNKWSGFSIEDTYGNKAILDYNGEPVFAELAILRIFEKDGWTGAWVDTYRRKFRDGYWGNSIELVLPKEMTTLLNNIYKTAGIKSGCWDVICWKEDNIIFAEAKRRGKDKIRTNQVRFLEAALSSGLKESSFLLVKWDLA